MGSNNILFIMCTMVQWPQTHLGRLCTNVEWKDDASPNKFTFQYLHRADWLLCVVLLIL